MNFKRRIDGVAEEYFPNQLSRFRFAEDKLYESFRAVETDSLIFVEVLVEGRIKLSKYNDVFYLTNEGDSKIYVIEESIKESNVSGKLTRSRSTRHIGIIQLLLNDCKQQAIQDFRVSEKRLTELIEQYNICYDGESISYKSKKPWIKFNYGVTLRLEYSNINFLNLLILTMILL